MTIRNKAIIKRDTYKNSLRHRLFQSIKNKYLLDASGLYDGRVPIYYITDQLIPDFDDGLDSFSLCGYRFWVIAEKVKDWTIQETDNLSSYDIDLGQILSACEITEQEIINELDVQFSKMLLTSFDSPQQR